jgi:hypothetical protein
MEMKTKKFLITFTTIVFLFTFYQNGSESLKSEKGKFEVLFSKVLSTNGSTRATAYMMSNKIITANNKIFVAWLDRVADIQMKVYDMRSASWSETELIGEGVDNHSGPTITMDGKGYLHVVFGPHHGPFQYARSSRPFDINKWEPVQHFGINGTYPSLIIDSNDQLHCAYRGGSEPNRLMYQQKPKNGDWTEPIELVHPGVDTGYTQYGNSLIIAPDETIHLGFHIYDRVKPAAGKAIGYLCSKDSGKNWQNASGQPIQLPTSPKSSCFIEQGRELDMRCGNLAIDPDGHPWLTAFHNEKKPRSVTLWHHDGKKWIGKELLEVVKSKYPEWELLYSCISFDKNGILYSASAIQKEFGSTYWGDPSLEIILLTSTDRGEIFDIISISTIDPNLPNWLPNIERPYGPKPINIPSFLYTRGGPGIGLTEGDATEVIFVRLGRNKL